MISVCQRIGSHALYMLSGYLEFSPPSLLSSEHEPSLSTKRSIGMLPLYTCFPPLIPYSPDTRTRIEVGGMLVKKTFMKPDSAEHVAFLSRIYGVLRRKNVPHTDFLQSASFQPGNSSIITRPVGLHQWPDDGCDAYNALFYILVALKVLDLPIS